MRKSIKCDYCEKSLEYEDDSIMHKQYWQSNFGINICDDCLPDYADDFLDMPEKSRLFALRLRWSSHAISLDTINEMLRDAEETVVPEKIDGVRYDTDSAISMFNQGFRLAAIMKGVAIWYKTCALYLAKEFSFEVEAARKTKKQHVNAGFSSGKQRKQEKQPEWDKYQETVDELHAKKPRLSHTEISRRVAPFFGVTDRTIRGRTTLKKVGKERPLS